MADWKLKLDEFLRFNERAVLPDAGRVSREEADRKALAEYERFGDRRRARLEAEGETEITRQLAEAAQRVSARKKSRKTCLHVLKIEAKWVLI